MEEQNNKGELVQALAKATLEFKSIGKNASAKVTTKSGGQYSYGYATLDEIINATKEALSNNGLVISHTTKEINDKMWLISKLRHESGCKPDKVKSQIDKYLTEGYMSAVQSYGSIITYLKRYHLGMLLNIAIDEDNDGDIADKKSGAKTGDNKQVGKADPASSAKGNDDKVKDYKTRIEACKNIFEMKAWGEKHKDEIKKLPKDDQDKVREIFSLTQGILQKEQDADKLAQLTGKPIADIKAFMNADDLWGDTEIIKALKGDAGAIATFDEALEGFLAEKAVDLLGNDGAEHKDPTA